MAKATSTTVKVGSTKIKGATAADKQTIAAAKASVRSEPKTVTAADTPEAQPSASAKKAAAKQMFAKADRAGDAATPEEGTMIRAVRGW